MTSNINSKILPSSKRSTRACMEYYLKNFVPYKRSQGAVEFAIILGFVLFFFAVFFVIIQVNQSEKNREKEQIIIQNVALDVQKEISLAAESTNGYIREFKTPLNILGKDYTINITGQFIYISSGKSGVSYKIQPVTGSIQKGSNIIKKENDTVYLNQ